MGIEIKTIEIGEIPATPQTENLESVPYNKFVAQATLELINHTRQYGALIGYEQEQNGRAIHNLIPQKKFENDQISGSSKTELVLHTESAFHPYKPTHIHLLCLRGDENAATTYANVEDIISHLTRKDLELLQTAEYRTGIDKSFSINGEDTNPQIITPLRQKTNTWEICYDGELTYGLYPAQAKALQSLKEAIAKSVKEITLVAGQILTINNNTTIHGRKSFQARYDGTDRWILRTLTIRPNPPRTHFEGNVVTTKFNN